MMKKITIITIALLVSEMLFSQQIYFGINGAYNFGISKQNAPMFFSGTNEMERIIFADYIYFDNSPISIKAVPVSFGSGFSYGANIGFMLKNFGFEIQAYYLKSETYTAKIASDFTSNMWAENINIIPTLVFKSDTSQLSFIAKAGVILSKNKVDNFNL